MATTKKETAPKRYVIVPRTNEGYKEMYAVSGEKKFAFGVPVMLTPKDILQIENQKESVKSGGMRNPYEYAKEAGISIDQAMERLATMGNVASSADEIQWLRKYDIHSA